MQKIQTGRAKRPPLHISDVDYDLIADLALRIEPRQPELSRLLLDEINRAAVHPPARLPADVVSLGSEVEFLDDSTGASRRVRLVLPAEADIDAGRVSILTPVGAGLIGLSVGSEISWPCPDGTPRVLKILGVTQRP